MHQFPRIFKYLLASAVILLGPNAALSEEVPAPLGSYFRFDEPVKAQVIVIKHKDDFLKLQQKILKYRAKNQEAFDKHYAGHDAGLPYPFSEFVGLTEEEHAGYMKAWNQRKIEPVAAVQIRVDKGEGNRHRLRIQGDPRVVPGGVALLRFNANTGKIETLNKPMERIADINTDKNSVLGPWKGVEWRGLESDGLVTTTENLVIGERTDSTYCYMIYRKREIESDGRPVIDQTMLLRFLPKAKRQAK